MNEEIREFEKGKANLAKYFSKLDHDYCKLYGGPFRQYDPPERFWEYKDAEDFKKRYIKDKSEKDHAMKYCSIIGEWVPLDNSKRFFKNTHTYDECKKIAQGHWDPDTLNRQKKFARGQCWKGPEEIRCAKATDERFLKPYFEKYTDRSEERIAAAQKCQAEVGCKWQQQSKHTWDCIPGVPESIVNTKSATPGVEAMPNVGMEKWVFRYYTGKHAPNTTQLIGEGNRCRASVVPVVSTAEMPKPKTPFYDIQVMDPKNPDDIKIIKKYLSKSERYEYFYEWELFNKYGPTEFMKNYGPDSVFYHLHSLLIYRQFMEDEPLKEPTPVKVSTPDIKAPKEPGMYPSVPQSVVNSIMKRIASGESDRRGMLAWHSTGSGKTCTATGVIEAFWDTKRPIIFASSVDAIASNPPRNFHECAMRFYSRFKDSVFKGSTTEDSLALIDAAFRARDVRFLTFAKLSRRVKRTEDLKKSSKKKVAVESKPKAVESKPKGKKAAPAKQKGGVEIPKGEEYVDLENAILIIDEVHNLFRPLANQKEEHRYLESKLLDPKIFPHLKIVILTATPGDNIPDVLKLLNIIREPTKSEIVLPDINDPAAVIAFKESIRGMISFFDMSSDNTKFPVIQDTSEFIRAPMSEVQFEKYVEAYKSVKGDGADFDKLAKGNKITKYWEPARKYANMLYTFEKGMALGDFSAKMPYLLENLKKYENEKHYVYSSFYTKSGFGGQGIVAIAKILEAEGYKQLTVKEAKKMNLQGVLPNEKNHKGKDYKRYILAITTDLDQKGGTVGENLHELVKIYNNAENRDGKLVQVMLASQTFNEGIDLKGVRHIHFFEPVLTMASDKQTLGRAARYCSHADLDRDKGEWSVKIHRYMSDKPVITMKTDVPVVEEEDSSKKELRDLELQMLDFDTDEVEAEIKEAKKAKKDTTKLQKKLTSMREQIKKIKAKITAIKKAKPAKKKPTKKKLNINPADIENIEERIFRESRERMKELLVVYQCMKEAAVDCLVLKKFHSSTGTQVKCGF